MKKRLFAGLLALTFVLSACGTNNKDTMMEDTMMETEEMMDDNMDESMMETEEMMDESMMETEEMMDESMMETEEMMDESKMEDEMALEEGEFELLNGGTYNLNEQKGKKVYVKYWASWCPICLSSLQEFDDFSTEDTDFEVVSIVSPYFFGEKSKEDFKEWFDGLDYKNMKVLIDENGKYISQFGIRATPSNIIIDSNGEVVNVIPGQVSKDVIKQVFDEVN